VRGLSLWQIEAPGPGFDRLDGDLRADVVVVGAGVTGLACARRLAEAGMDVAVVDASRIGGGASGRNGGFAVVGTELGFGEARDRLGEAAAVELHRATGAGMVALSEAMGAPGAVRVSGSVELARSGAEEAALAVEVAAMRAAGLAVELDPARVPRPLRAWYATAAHRPADGEIHPTRWIGALAAAAAAAGARIHEHTPVTAVRAGSDGWEAASPAGIARAPVAVVACDGLTRTLVPELRDVTHPVRGQMLASEPVADRVLEMPTYSDGGFMYYRQTAGGRVVVGGSRDAAMEDEFTDDERTTEIVQDAIERFLRERLGVAAPVSHRWAGVMGFSVDLLPVAGPIPERPGLFAAAGYSGVGNVQGFLCGGLIADAVLGRPHPLGAIYAPERLLG
jgi:glycine/D-amino acid oxidase-like deaminating enzyme